MAYLLRSLILIMILSVGLTTAVAHNFISFPFIYTIFAQAFVMFYFIGVSRLVDNIHLIISTEKNLHELFDEPPADLTPYKDKVKRFVHEATLAKKQTIPWTMLMLILGMIAFLLGGAHDTGMVAKTTHSGVVYGFFVAMTIGFFRQWWFLGKTHILLRKVKGLFSLHDHAM
jgi:hypothetical protein